MNNSAQLKLLTQDELDELFKSLQNLKLIWSKPTTLNMVERLLEDEQERRDDREEV